MKHLITKFFKDKVTGNMMIPSHYFVCEDYERIQYLASLGLIIPHSNTEQLNKKTKEEVKKETKEEVKKTAQRNTRARKTSDA